MTRFYLGLQRVLAAAMVVLALAGCSVSAESLGYEPREGDVVFQSLGDSPVTLLITGATHSPFSHCGMVFQRDGKWMVIEAIGPVREIELGNWIRQGRYHGVAAYRLKEEHRRHIPKFIAAAQAYLGRPYDSRYRFDDETIYCSELVFKAWRDVTGTQLGRVRKVSELNWQPYEPTIRRLEQGGPVPLERELITPKDLAEAEQLEPVFRKSI